MKRIASLFQKTAFLICIIFPFLHLKAQVKIIDAVEYRQITSFETDYSIVAMKVSGDGSKIVFSTGGPFIKVYTMNADGSGLKEIYDFQSTGSGPSVDIDATGTKVIWCDGFGEIFCANSDGSSREELATLLPNPDTNFGDLEPVIPVPPRISANGTQVFFMNADRDPRASGAWRVNADGSGLTQLFNYLKISEDVFGSDGSEYDYSVAFTDGYDISGNGSVMIFGTRIFKLGKGDLDRGDAIVASGTEFYKAGDYALGNQPFATNPDGNRFILYKREFNENLGHDEINVYFVPIGTGDPVKVVSGLDIFGGSAYTQMAGDGSRAITYAANGRLPITLVDRISASQLDLVSIDGISISTGGFRFSESRLPTIAWNGNRFWFLATSIPTQIWSASINSDAVNSQPAISTIVFEPAYAWVDGSSVSTISALVTHLEDTIRTVTFDAFQDGRYRFRVINSDWPYNGFLVDNGTTGDASANDGFFTNNTIRADLPETPLGNYTIRIAAVDATMREVSFADANTFSIIEPNTTSTGSERRSPVFVLSQNYPNPFRNLSLIHYEIPASCHAEITVFDLTGRKVTTLVSGHHLPGRYSVRVDNALLPAGLYLYTLHTSGFFKTLLMQVIR